MSSNSDDVYADLERWNDKINKITWIYQYMILISNLVVFLASSIAIVVVIVVRKRTECFIVCTLACYFLGTIITIMNHVYIVYYQDNEPKWEIEVTYIGIFLYTMAHWFFSS